MFRLHSSRFHGGRRARPRLTAKIEALERRQLFSAGPDPLTVIIGEGAAKSVQFVDASGTHATVQLSGPGTASVSFGGTGLTQSANMRGLVVNGAASLDSISASGTTGGTTIQIITRGKLKTSAGDISSDGPLSALRATGVVVTGDITTGGLIHQIQLGGAQGGDISIGAARAGGVALVASLGSVSDESISSTGRIVVLAASQWMNTPGSGESITASQINVINIAHDLTADITTGGIGAFNVGGTLSSSTINLTTPLVPHGVNLNRMSVGGTILDSTLVSGGSLGAISAAQMQGSQIYAGLVALPSGQTLPLATTDFRNVASIKSVSLRRSASGSFVNSDVAAYMIGATSLGDVSMANGGVIFGIAAHQVQSVTLLDESTGKSVHAVNPSTTTAFNALLTAKGITPQDFVVRIV